MVQGFSSSPPTPVAVACLLCDRVIIDEDVGDRTIIGEYDEIWYEQFPGSLGSSMLFLKVIDCEGQYDLRIDYVQVSTQELLDTFEAVCSYHDRQSYAEFNLRLPRLSVPEPGEYELRVWMNERFVTSIRLKAHLDDDEDDSEN